jgi:hypothetical protein
MRQEFVTLSTLGIRGNDVMNLIPMDRGHSTLFPSLTYSVDVW